MEGLDVFGTDINPLARLIAESKTNYSINPDDLSNEIANFQVNIDRKDLKLNIPDIRNVETCFKSHFLEPLGKIRNYIDNIQDSHIHRFFQVAFSETVRESSNTRKGEFKLFRYAPYKLKTHSPCPYKIMLSKLERNFRGYIQFNQMMKYLGGSHKATILGPKFYI